VGLTMATGRFSDLNLFAGAAISGPAGGWSTAWPLANLLTEGDYIGSPARCVAPTDLSLSWFELVFDEPTVVQMPALFFHTLSMSARYRITVTTLADAAYAAPLLQTDWEWVFPSLYDPEELEFGADNSFAGTLPLGEIDLFKRHLFAPIDEALGQRLRIEIDDAENPDGYFDIGGAWGAAGFSPTLNFERGRDLVVVARDLIDEAPSGRLFAEERAPRRELSLTWANLLDPEARRFIDVAMRSRGTRTVLFVPDVDEPAALIREAFPATLSKLPGARFTYPGLGVSSLTLKEILA